MRRIFRRGLLLGLTGAIALLYASFAVAAPTPTAPQGISTGPTAKKNAAAAKRLKRQRDHMERQRERLKKNRERFKANTKLVRKRLKEERKKAQAKASQSSSAGDMDQGTADKDDQGDTPEDDEGESDVWSGFFPWATNGGVSDNLLTGLGFAALGIAGALILIFGLLGSYLPSMGGKAEYDALQVEIKALAERRDKQLASRERFVRDGEDPGAERRQEAAGLTDDLSRVIESKEEEARRKYRQALSLGIPIYVLVGGALAVLVASNALQALLIGFAWTSIADRLGLKREQTEKKTINNANVEKLENAAAEAGKEKVKAEEKVEELKNLLVKSNQTAARMKRKK